MIEDPRPSLNVDESESATRDPLRIAYGALTKAMDVGMYMYE